MVGVRFPEVRSGVFLSGLASLRAKKRSRKAAKKGISGGVLCSLSEHDFMDLKDGQVEIFEKNRHIFSLYPFDDILYACF